MCHMALLTSPQYYMFVNIATKSAPGPVLLERTKFRAITQKETWKAGSSIGKLLSSSLGAMWSRQINGLGVQTFWINFSGFTNQDKWRARQWIWNSKIKITCWNSEKKAAWRKLGQPSFLRAAFFLAFQQATLKVQMPSRYPGHSTAVTKCADFCLCSSCIFTICGALTECCNPQLWSLVWRRYRRSLSGLSWSQWRASALNPASCNTAEDKIQETQRKHVLGKVPTSCWTTIAIHQTSANFCNQMERCEKESGEKMTRKCFQ